MCKIGKNPRISVGDPGVPVCAAKQFLPASQIIDKCIPVCVSFIIRTHVFQRAFNKRFTIKILTETQRNGTL